MWQEEVLVGKTIIGLRVKSPFVWLEVEGGGWIQIEAVGDCCSDAFIDATRFNGELTLTGKSVEISFPSQPTEQEVDEVTAVSFLSDRGYLTIVHRNSSNGYYGNYLSFNSRGVPPEDAANGKEWYREMS